jgi:hypothetical protein
VNSPLFLIDPENFLKKPGGLDKPRRFFKKGQN